MLLQIRNREDPNRSAVSDLGLHCLSMSHRRDFRFKWVKAILYKGFINMQCSVLALATLPFVSLAQISNLSLQRTQLFLLRRVKRCYYSFYVSIIFGMTFLKLFVKW